MLHLHYFPTPNGQKGRIMLEEVGLAYELHLVDIRAGKNLGKDYRGLAPSRRF